MEPQFPFISKDLIEALERLHPERSAEPQMSINELMFHGGKVDLVRWLRAEYEDQNGQKE